MSLIRRNRSVVVVLALVLTLSACSSSDDTSEADPSTGDDSAASVPPSTEDAATSTTAATSDSTAPDDGSEAPDDDSEAPDDGSDPDCVIVDLDVVNPLLDFTLTPAPPNTFANGTCTLLLDSGGFIKIGVYEATVPFDEFAANKPLRTNVGEPGTAGDRSVFLTGSGVEGFIVDVDGKRAMFELELGLNQERPAASNWETLLDHVVDRVGGIKALPGDT